MHTPLAGEPGRVLLLVVRAVVVGLLDPLPPDAVVAVPGDGRGEALGERPAAAPAERFELGRVERVAPIVARPVVDAPDQRLVRAGQLEDAARDLAVLDLLAAADVVDLSRLALAERQLDPGAVILDVEPVPHLLAVAVERQ